MSAASGSCRPGDCHPVMAGTPCITYTRTPSMPSIIFGTPGIAENVLS